MHTKRFLFTIGLALLLSTIALGIVFAITYSRDAKAVAETTVEDVLLEAVEIRRARMHEEPVGELPDESEINVLLLGLDARKEDKAPHCDAIHMFSLNLEDWTMHITSVPRGTYAYIPTDKLTWEKFDPANFPPPPPPEPDPQATEGTSSNETTPAPELKEEPASDETHSMELNEEQPPWDPKIAYIQNQSYISNSCALVGMDYGIAEIEKVTRKQADYVVTVGFSQTLGILRELGMPTTESLQFLRHRQGYAIGDPQRSHNQAVFLKDLLIRHGERLSQSLTLPLERVFYSFVDTDMSFAVAHTLLHGYLENEIYAHPDRITLSMRPHYETQDYHFDPENPLEHLEHFLEYIGPHLSEKDFSDLTIEDIQVDLITYLTNRLKSEKPIDDILEKRLWLQLEDGGARELVEYNTILRHALTLPEAEAETVIADYILEKETLGNFGWAERGKQLLRELEEEAQTQNTPL